MTPEDRCSYRWKWLERKSTRRRRGGTTGSGLAAERGIGVQRVEAVPVPAQARDGSHRPAIPAMPKNCRVRDVSAFCGRAAELQNPRCRG
jgi:hypothetical protein